MNCSFHRQRVRLAYVGFLILDLAMAGCGGPSQTAAAALQQNGDLKNESRDKATNATVPLARSQPYQVLVRIERQATEKYEPARFYGPGIVIKKEDARAYVVAWPQITQGPDPAPFSCHVLVENDAAPVEVAARPIAHYLSRSCYVFTAAADELPDPLSLDKIAEAKESMPVQVSGYKTRGDESRFLEVDGVVSKIHRDQDGAIRYLQVDAQSKLEHGLVTTAENALVGVDLRNVNLGTDERPEVVWCARPPKYFASLDEPEWQATSLEVRSSDQEGAVFDVRVRVAEPWQRLRNPQLLLVPQQRRIEPWPFAEPDGGDWGRMSDDALVLPLERVAPAAEPRLASRGNDRFGCNTLLTTAIKGPPLGTGASEMRLYQQLSFERPDGSRHYQRPVSIQAYTSSTTSSFKWYAWTRLEAAE